MVCCGAQFMTKRPAVGRALHQGVRDYNGALKDGRIAGPAAEDVVDAIARYSVTRDRDLIRSVISAALQTLGLVKSNVVVAGIMSFPKAAAAELGPYQGRSGRGPPVPDFMVQIVPISLQFLLR